MNTTMVAGRRHHADLDGGAGGEAILHLAEGGDMADKSGLFFNGMNRRRPIRRPTTRPPASGCARSASS